MIFVVTGVIKKKTFQLGIKIPYNLILCLNPASNAQQASVHVSITLRMLILKYNGMNVNRSK